MTPPRCFPWWSCSPGSPAWTAGGAGGHVAARTGVRRRAAGGVVGGSPAPSRRCRPAGDVGRGAGARRGRVPVPGRHGRAAAAVHDRPGAAAGHTAGVATVVGPGGAARHPRAWPSPATRSAAGWTGGPRPKVGPATGARCRGATRRRRSRACSGSGSSATALMSRRLVPDRARPPRGNGLRRDLAVELACRAGGDRERAALVVLGVGVRAARVHGRSVLAPLATAGAVVLVTAITVAGLLSMQPAGTAQAVASRRPERRAEHAGPRRAQRGGARHVPRPPLGRSGLGSYKSLAREWNDPEGNLTSSAHDEYAEVAGETGHPRCARPCSACSGGLGVDGSGGPAPTAPPRLLTDVRPGLVVGATGVAALFLVHSAVDFDWNYPVLSGMAAMAAAMLLPERVAAGRPGGWHGRPRPGRRPAARRRRPCRGRAWREPAPWHDRPTSAPARDRLESGRPRAALEAAAAGTGVESRLARVPARYDALATYELDDDVPTAPGRHRRPATWFSGRAQAAMALARDGEVDRGQRVLEPAPG